MTVQGRSIIDGCNFTPVFLKSTFEVSSPLQPVNQTPMTFNIAHSNKQTKYNKVHLKTYALPSLRLTYSQAVTNMAPFRPFRVILVIM